MFLISVIYGQGNDNKKQHMKNFSFGFDFFSDIWQNVPESLELSTINRGVSLSGMYNYQFGKSNFSFAIGLGFTSHNMYTNSFVVTDTTEGKTYFKPINDSLSNIEYKKSKVSVSYLEIPVEFRLKTTKKFRLALGFKLGYLIDKHYKYKGDDFQGGEGEAIYKHNNIDYLEKYRYGPTFRIGYKFINLMAYYQISKLFKPDQGPDMYPISVGITIMPY